MITGSAMRKLEAMTGLIVRKEATGYTMTVAVPPITYYSRKQDEKEACQDLRDQNWKRISREVFELQGWKCANCLKQRPLQAHHHIFRSQWSRKDGPLDHQKNVIGLCAECHQKEHGIRTASGRKFY